MSSKGWGQPVEAVARACGCARRAPAPARNLARHVLVRRAAHTRAVDPLRRRLFSLSFSRQSVLTSLSSSRARTRARSGPQRAARARRPPRPGRRPPSRSRGDRRSGRSRRPPVSGAARASQVAAIARSGAARPRRARASRRGGPAHMRPAERSDGRGSRRDESLDMRHARSGNSGVEEVKGRRGCKSREYFCRM